MKGFPFFATIGLPNSDEFYYYRFRVLIDIFIQSNYQKMN